MTEPYRNFGMAKAMETGAHYPINTLYPTIQGEGVQAGLPMVLVRFQGCPVGCPFCDTKETWHLNDRWQEECLDDAIAVHQNAWARVSPSEINAAACGIKGNAQWAMLTGGEPAMYALGPLVAALHDGGFKVALETSGCFEILHPEALDWITVSPKIGMPGGLDAFCQPLAVADEIKMVIGKKKDISALDALLAKHPTKESVEICLQPMSLNKKATALCVATVQERGWRLSVQTHHYLDLP